MNKLDKTTAAHSAVGAFALALTTLFFLGGLTGCSCEADGVHCDGLPYFRLGDRCDAESDCVCNEAIRAYTMGREGNACLERTFFDGAIDRNGEIGLYFIIVDGTVPAWPSDTLFFVPYFRYDTLPGGELYPRLTGAQINSYLSIKPGLSGYDEYCWDSLGLRGFNIGRGGSNSTLRNATTDDARLPEGMRFFVRSPQFDRELRCEGLPDFGEFTIEMGPGGVGTGIVAFHRRDEAYPNNRYDYPDTFAVRLERVPEGW